MKTKGKIIFENKNQKVLFDFEIRGQLSDGHWENSRPSNHWRPWDDAETLISSGEKCGTLFEEYIPRRNYNLTSNDLLKCVGDRVRNYVKLSKRINVYLIGNSELPDDLKDYDNTVKYSKNDKTSNYWVRKFKKWENAGITREMMKEIENDNSYSMKDLKKDLNAMKRIFKIIL